MSVLGVLVLNLLFLLAGSGILWGARGWETWREYAKFSGVAYMSGLCAVTVLATLVPIYGGRLSGGTIVGLVAGIGAAGLVVGRLKRRPLPRSDPSPLRYDYVALALVGITGVLLALFFRVARSQPMTSWDAWAFWTTKGKAIFYFGGLDPTLFRGQLSGSSYPLLVPVLDAMNFRFMGSAGTTALGIQWWLLVVGFVAAVPALLRRVAPPRITWLFLALFVSLPQLDDRLLERTGDWPLDLFVGVAACALLAWVLTRESWLLAVFGLALAAGLLTKREGQLLAVCLVVAGIVAAGVRDRRAWIALVGVGLLAYLPGIPWRLWWTSRHLPADTPPGGLLHATLSHIGKAPEAFHLVAGQLFEYHYWLAATPVAIAAALVGLVRPDRRAATFFLVAFGLGFVGWAWQNWAYVDVNPITTDRSLNPTYRTVASLVVLAIVAAPVLLGRLLPERVVSAGTATSFDVLDGPRAAS